ncbi:sporulation protein SpoOM [Lottiidibacillus patelloidae]|uniref:Sporulation protein SpoOM n=1 Tax=Lottiidibacillus patelloidae TaxID=2670334 RepID=A0A263BRL4_9BACI|nr:sporulation protein [Lottiidibacillus patelloidae]OZM56351.1 sporulation protein SpoOM [Lottiidibacillus patelloidae]
MSFMKKMLSSIGIGSAKVDTQLHQAEMRAGETITGDVVITGGNVEQEVSSIYLAVMTTYEKEVDDNKVTNHATVDKFKVSEEFIIQANETKTIPFEITLPSDTPITIGNCKVWLQTGLDIKNAVDPSDRDYVRVLPNIMAEKVLDAIESLGFTIRKVKNEEAPYKLRKRLPFVQEFEFYPTSGSFRGKLDELEAIFFFSNTNCELLLEIDRKAKGIGGFLSEMLDTDETIVKLSFTNEDVNEVKNIIETTINRHC